MSSIIIFNDLHLADNPPASRTEGYREEGLAMLREIVNLANRMGPACEAVVSTGDLFHVKQPHRNSHALVREVIDILDGLMCGPLVTAAGNHDMGPGGWDALDRQPLGVLAASGKVTLSTMTTEHFYIVPLGYDQDMDTDPTWYRSQTETGRIYVMAAHGSVVPDGTDREFPTLPASEALKGSTVDVLACGHIHEDLGVHYYDRPGPRPQVYLNFGSLGRTARTKANMTRTVKIAVLGTDLSVLPLPLSTALPANMAFKPEAPIVDTDDEGISAFVQAMASATGFETMELRDFIRQVCDEAAVGPELEARLLAYVEEA